MRALSLPKTHHTSNSSQIMTGRASATPSTMSDLSPPAVRDRYGFKKVSQHITLVEHDVWNFHYIEYLDRRRKKWVTLMKKCGLPYENPKEFPPPSDQVKRFIRKGLPPDWRGAAWFFYAGGPQNLAQNPTLYSDLMEQINEGALSDLDREHIERDLHRTFPDNIRFKPEFDSSAPPSETQSFDRPDSTAMENETSILKALRRVLQAFAIHNPNIGYCQSLNFLAGLLLLFLEEDEEKAFILLNIITTEHLPGTHGKILGANIDIGVLMGCIKESMPLVWAAIDDTNDPSGHSSHVATAAARLPTVSLATTSWFMSLFVSSLPIETVLRVWDCLFYEGSKTLFRIALAIFKIGEDFIRAVNDPMEIFQIVQNLPRKLINPNALMEACFKKRNGFGHLTQETIDQRRLERRRSNVDDVTKLTNVPKTPVPDEISPKLVSTRTNTMDDTFDRIERERWAQEPQPLVKRATTKSKFKRSLSRKKPLPGVKPPLPSNNMI
ncbi:RabGAP/TBC [Pseudovirgaria hyperparasitica]|uniref:RabGAP/TBC n=1 Tax=Pseudovirgaria hyperparasitica TaxID=470096 RepID=A0A6A6WER5_9PEZI|nr:RabGAP/TBC [Pseudovirgaria hyperparasitica]KAF2761312.1 RabGAP/TBC [Pseudovirgaria hyperparasitica]